MLILNVLIVDFHDCMFPLKQIVFLADLIQFTSKLVQSVVPVLLDFLNADELHLVFLHFIEGVFVQLLQALTLVSILNPLIIGFLER
jgi:hypothetical protein